MRAIEELRELANAVPLRPDSIRGYEDYLVFDSGWSITVAGRKQADLRELIHRTLCALPALLDVAEAARPVLEAMRAEKEAGDA